MKANKIYIKKLKKEKKKLSERELDKSTFLKENPNLLFGVIFSLYYREMRYNGSGHQGPKVFV